MKILLTSLFAILVFAPSQAEAACAYGQSELNGINASVLSAPGNLAIQINIAPIGSECEEYAAVTWTTSGVQPSCSQGASYKTIPGGYGGSACVSDGSAAGKTSRATINMSTVNCGQSITGYAMVGRRDGSSWLWGATRDTSKTRNCGNAEAETEEDCEVDPAWEWQYNGTCVTEGTPILISVGKDKPGLKDYSLTTAEDGVLFDIDNDGVLDQMAWTKKNAPLAFLALDRNGNGRIDGGFELFGNKTAEAAGHGFAALATLTGEAVQVDASNPFYASLLLWTDANHNGQSEPEELRPLSSQFSAIYTVAVPSTLLDRYGNRFAYIGLIEEAGTRDTRVIYDVFLKRQ